MGETYFGENTGKLGFGLMRLPKKGLRIDVEQTKEMVELFRACRPELSYASWAIRFVASLPGIITVLSGMSNVAQMKDNLSYMRDFRPLDEEEQKIIREAQLTKCADMLEAS